MHNVYYLCSKDTNPYPAFSCVSTITF